MDSQTLENSPQSSDASQQASAAEGTFGQSLKTSCTKLHECVDKNPRTSLLVSLGAGLGAGILLGTMLAGSRSGSNSWFQRRSAERLGQQIMSQMGNWLPDALSDRLTK